MDPKKPNKITEIVRLQQMLKKWKKLSVSPKDVATKKASEGTGGGGGGGGGGGFLKRTFSLTDTSSMSSSSAAVPKGFVAVCVGEELRRFVIPMEYLSHRTFAGLLRDAAEEFGFQQEGVLRIPCEVTTFQEVLKVVEEKKKKNKNKNKKKDVLSSCSSEVGWLSPNSRALMGHYTDHE